MPAQIYVTADIALEHAEEKLITAFEGGASLRDQGLHLRVVLGDIQFEAPDRTAMSDACGWLPSLLGALPDG
jgi:hypothetical protein